MAVQIDTRPTPRTQPLSHPKDDVLDAAEIKLPSISVSKAQGEFLNLLVKSIGVKRILEIGTLGGYSTIWFARTLPEDGEIITLELSPRRAKLIQRMID